MQSNVVNVYSTEGLSRKIDKMRLSKIDAHKLKTAINHLETMSLKSLITRGKIHRLRGANELYVYRVTRNIRLIVSEVGSGEQKKNIIHDIVNLAYKEPFMNGVVQK